MIQNTELQRMPAIIGAVLMGAICGALLAALANSISESRLAAAVILFVATFFGATAGRFSGARVGSVCGALLVALASLMGDSQFGIISTIVGCSVLAAWLQWLHPASVEA